MKITRQSRLVLGIALGLAGMGGAQAESMEQRMARMEAMLAEMQQRMDAQSEKIREQEATIASQKQTLDALPAGRSESAADEGGGTAWFERVEVGGLVEVEIGHHSPYQGDSESDLVLATFELGISAQVTDWVEAGGSLLYEEDDTDLEVDTAYVTIGNLEVSPLYVTAGQIYLPFGAFESNLLSDPLTLEIGEARESTLLGGFVSGDFSGSVFVFNGDNKEDGKNRIGAWGLNLGFSRESGDNVWGLGFGYISDLGDSDTLQGVIADNRGDNDIANRVGGWTVNAGASFGPFNLIGEYLSAADSFDATDVPWRLGGAEPKAFNVEAGYSFTMMGREAVLALAYQGTREALALELPKERWLLGLSVGIMDNTYLSLEWARDKDYDLADGGTGENADTVTVQLAVEF